MTIVMDMDMPKYCNECYYCTDSFGECDLTHEHIPNYEFWSENNEKPEWCPLKPVDEKSKQISKDDVLDKIRAEIEARLCDVVSDYTDGYRTAIQGDLAILDRYKAESEG